VDEQRTTPPPTLDYRRRGIRDGATNLPAGNLPPFAQAAIGFGTYFAAIIGGLGLLNARSFLFALMPLVPLIFLVIAGRVAHRYLRWHSFVPGMLIGFAITVVGFFVVALHWRGIG
jgi:hypothetical protein